MTQSKHTPGPWVLTVTPKSEWMHEDPEWEISAPSDEGVALMGNVPYYPWQSDNLADAYLIAAAPELLEALKLAHDYLAGSGLEGDPRMDPIISAIAKAEGRE